MSLPPRLVSRAEFARLKGVSRPAITKACKGALAPACVDDRINLDHPAAKVYLGAAWPAPSRKKARTDAAPPKPRSRAQVEPAAPTEPEEEAEPESEPPPAPRPGRTTQKAPALDKNGYSDELAEWTLFQIAERFGTLRAFKDHLEAHEKLERARKLRLDNEETEGLLIDREFVDTHVFGAIEAVFRRLLTDVPKTGARTVRAQSDAGTALEESEAYLRKLISDQLTPMKDKVIRILRRGNKS